MRRGISVTEGDGAWRNRLPPAFRFGNRTAALPGTPNTGLSPGVGELDPRRGALAANEGGDASEGRNVIVFPDARILGRDTPTRLYSRGFHEHKSGASRGAAAEMDQVPIIDEAILGRILAHGRY